MTDRETQTKILDDHPAAAGSAAEQPGEVSLPKWDWIILPLLSLLTLCVLIFSLEFISSRMFRESDTSALRCLILTDPKTGVRAIPNTVCWQKLAESPFVEYKFNNCGLRSVAPCGSKSPGTIRIVSIGSSISEGFAVPFDQTFAARLPKALSLATGRKVELDNQAMQWGTPYSVDLRFPAALAAKPDLILWTVTPWDVENVALDLPVWLTPGADADSEESQQPKFAKSLRGTWQHVLYAYHRKPIYVLIGNEWRLIVEELTQTKTVFALEHFLYESQGQYVKHYLMQEDSAGFLRTRTPAAWQTRWQKFDALTANMAEQAKAAGVPFVVAVVPQRAEAALISTGKWPPGIDPYKFGQDVKSVAKRHGALYIDLLPGFRNIPTPEKYFLPVDGHLDGRGHAILTQLLADKLTDGVIPVLKANQQPPHANREGD